MLRARVNVGQDDAVGDGGGIFRTRHGGNSRVQKQLVIAGGKVAALLIPGCDVAEFYLQYGGLQGVEPGVPADLVVEVAASHAVGAQRAGVGRQRRGARGEQAGVAHGGEVFGGVEAEGSSIAERASGSGIPAREIPAGSEGLGGVFDQQEAGVILLDGGEAVPVGALAVEVDRGGWP